MKKITSVWLLLVYLPFSGCISVQTVNSEYLNYDQSKALRIEMNDGSSIRLSSGDYRIVHKPDSLSIVGSGVRKRLTNGKIDEPFSGIIKQTEIRNIEIVEPTALVYTLPIYIGVVTAIGLLILLSFQGGGVGG